MRTNETYEAQRLSEILPFTLVMLKFKTGQIGAYYDGVMLLPAWIKRFIKRLSEDFSPLSESERIMYRTLVADLNENSFNQVDLRTKDNRNDFVNRQEMQGIISALKSYFRIV